MLTSSLAGKCQIFTVFLGVSQICFMKAPVGDCLHCCPRNDAVDIKYYLFTRSNPKHYQLIPMGDAAELSRTHFNSSLPTIIYLMGYSDTTKGESTITLRDTFLESGKYNFISVDWSRLIAAPWYIEAVQNTRYMGNRLAKFIQFLGNEGVSSNTIYVIGFSLGAEAAGFAGKQLVRQGVTLGRITGLDPAYPGYKFTMSDGHLAKGDALFVDVIHTNPGIFGFPKPIGDVDFYPNPGSWIQPGCLLHKLIENKEIKYFYGCSHNRSWRLYAESIRNPTGFPATLCTRLTSTGSCKFQIDGYMGVTARPPMEGKMYLLTNEKPPFAKGTSKVDITLSLFEDPPQNGKKEKKG